MKSLVKRITPPIIFDELKKLKGSKYGWKGNYNSWEEAVANSNGYDQKSILEKVRTSLKKVIEGKAVFERDSVLFYEEDYNWSLLGSLFYIAAAEKGTLNVLDFGGSLGSTYFQNRKLLNRLDSCSWSVVEQEHFVKLGKAEFEMDQLKFYPDIQSCLDQHQVNCLLLSSVLQYIEKPYELLSELLSNNIPYVLIDRMPFNTQGSDRICVQHVPPEIYQASYPCHLLDIKKFLPFFGENNYQLITSFDAIDGSSKDYEFKGFIFEQA